MLRQIEGSAAVAGAVAMCRPEVICAYPITPQTHIVEALGAKVKAGELAPCEFLNVESEFAAMSAVMLAARLPFHSPVFGGVALACVVAAPATWTAMLAWRRHARARDMAALAGLALISWIIVETAIVRQFSALQPVYGVAGLGLIVLGNPRILAQVAAAAMALPMFLTAPLWRRWHLRWGATAAEVVTPMPGDDLVPVSHFTATRAITIDAPPEAVWPWLVQVGFGRAGFYSYDLLDNLGRPSTDHMLSEFQLLAPGDLAAPMTSRPTPDTSFVIAEAQRPRRLVWSKPDSTWSWTLTPLPGGRTRLVTRLRQRYRLRPSALVTVVLAEFGDFPMMRRMLRGIKRRAEAGNQGYSSPHRAATTVPGSTQAVWPMASLSKPPIPAERGSSAIDLYWLPLGAGGHSVRWNGRIYERLASWHQHRPARSLFHAALEVTDHGNRYVIEMAPVWNERCADRGVVCQGPVGSKSLGRWRAFEYEVRCWRNGRIPDVTGGRAPGWIAGLALAAQQPQGESAPSADYMRLQAQRQFGTEADRVGGLRA